MICANNHLGKKCISWETEKSSAPFYCPECNALVQLKKGNKRMHHFAHKPPVSCIYGIGESDEHDRIKKEIYDFYSKQVCCTKCEMEYTELDGVRPDIFLNINNESVAIEIQKSTLPVNEIIRRTTRYTELGISILWIVPIGNYRPSVHKKTGQTIYRIKEWELFLHALYFGRLYYWNSGNMLKAIHFDDYMLHKEYSEWYEDGELVSAGDYDHKAKRLKTIVPLNKTLRIENDFNSKNRDCFRTKNWTIPKSKIFIDSNIKWWE